MEFPCHKFQANIFNKSRCQNCFKSRELHLMSNEELEQVKPIYASWLCLAPEGTDFDNPMQRSRKWQRRFFVLYEHGSLQFSLDELPSTIPQGTVDLNLCTDVTDAEARTGQKNALCVITPEQEIYIRGDSKEIINGWSEQLTLFLQTNKQSQRKKEPATTKKVVCSPEQEDGERKNNSDTTTVCEEPDAVYLGSGKVKPLDILNETCSVDTVEGSFLAPSIHAACTSPEPWGTESDPFPSDCSLPPSYSPLSSSTSSTSSVDWELDQDTESSSSSHDEPLSLTQAIDQSTDLHHEECESEDPCFTESRIQDDYLTDKRKGKMCQQCLREGRSRSQTHTVQNKERSSGFIEHPQRRARSLDIRTSECTKTPDLLNFKKGWLLQLNDHEQWRKFWFVLSAHSLHYYESAAEEASELVGEIDLTTCYKVTEYLVERSYGFQLLTHKLIYTLAALTAGIRQNWIQALQKNIQQRNAPDVASLADIQLLQGALCRPDVTRDSQNRVEHRSAHNKTFGCDSETTDWDETGHFCQEATVKQERFDLHSEKELEKQSTRSRRRGREERKQRYAIVMGSSTCAEEVRSSAGSPEQRLREIEERWQQVERTAIRKGKEVPLHPECKSTQELEKRLEHYQRRVEQLTVQITQFTDSGQSLENEFSPACRWLEPTFDLQCKIQKIVPNKQDPAVTLTGKYQETKQLPQLENLRKQHKKNQLGFCPSTQFINDLKVMSEQEVHCDMISHALWEATRYWEDEYSSVVKEDIGPDPAVVNLCCQEAEFLARQNEALNQHNQELLNQLAEANREIDRLKAELLHQPNGCQSELESVVERLEMEITRTCGQIQEARNQLVEMEENLKETHTALQLREATLRDLGFLTKDCEKISEISFLEETNRLCQNSQSLESKSQLRLSEQNCRELQNQNALLQESEVLHSEMIKETEEKVGTLQKGLEQDISCQWERLMHLQNNLVPDGRSSKETVQHVVKERVRMTSSVLSVLLEVIKHLTWSEKQESAPDLENAQMHHSVLNGLLLEKNLWEGFVNSLNHTPSQGLMTEGAGLLLCAKMKQEETEMFLSAINMPGDTSNLLASSRDSNPNHSANIPLGNLDINGIHSGTMKEEQRERTNLFNEQLALIRRVLEHHIENRLTLLNHVASKVESSTNEIHCNIFEQTNGFYLDPLVSVVMDVFIAYLIGNLLQEDRTLPIFEASCSKMASENHEKILEQNSHEETKANETDTSNSLRCYIKELEHVFSKDAKRIASLQQQHEEDKDRFKMEIVAAYEQGFALLKESHQRLTEDLLLKHQQELELVQKEKERLLAEEAAATFTVIEALKRTHCSELERRLQKANHENSSGDSGMAGLLKNHSDELALVQRELDALSEQFSKKCLECTHMAQALEAERKALQHCQQKNVDLSTRLQKLNNRFAEEVVRVSTMTNDGAFHLSGNRQQFELEIMLRVKEAEVFHLQQENSTLKNEIETVQMDQRLAIEKIQRHSDRSECGE
ncbi:myosin phosphatase Rho-interacting protein-like isoform X2 [Hoplias malabaricus]|uniref:myosin phosphatase Rho-interacting protein-like isoform X2 n=1 Tax=Hoplias malabaricus TaxID=27720 RepID=UPI003461F196